MAAKLVKTFFNTLMQLFFILQGPIFGYIVYTEFECFYTQTNASQNAMYFACVCLDWLGDNNCVFEAASLTPTVEAR